jgi:hypothetical protein
MSKDIQGDFRERQRPSEESEENLQGITIGDL